MRKIVALFVTLLILTACTTLAFAEEKLVEVSYTKPQIYDLVIPVSLPLSSGASKSFELGIGESNVEVSINIQSTNGMNLINEDGGSISYVIIDENTGRSIGADEWFSFQNNNTRMMRINVDDSTAIPGVTYRDTLKFVVYIP